MVDYGLKDRTVIITGANNPQGIGAATAFAFAREGAKYGITVNCVAPGPTQTGWIDKELEKVFGGHALQIRILMMSKEELKEYLDTRRMGWTYEDSYRLERLDGHRFVARIDDELAGLSYAEVSADGTEAVMKMNLKSMFAEYGIGTELLYLLMEDLQGSGLRVIRYEISPERYAFQIYNNLGFAVESQDEKAVRFIWRKEGAGAYER